MCLYNLIYSFGKMTSHKCKLTFNEGSKLFHEPPTNVTRVFYQCHEPSKLVHDSSKPTLTCGTPQFHNIGHLPLAPVWIFQTDFISLLAICDFNNLTFSTSCLLVLHSLPFRCPLVPLCFMFAWKPLALTSIFLWSFITIPQSWKQALMMYKPSSQKWSKVG